MPNSKKWSTLASINEISPDWPIKSLRSFAIKDKNGFVNGPFGSDLLSSELQDEGVPVIYIRDIKDSRYQRKSIVFVSKEKALSLPSCHTSIGDVIISKVGTPPCEAAVYTDKEFGIVTQDVIRIKTYSFENSTFLVYLLNSDIGKRQVKEIKITGTRERVSLTDFKKLRLPIPSNEEQLKIASILGTWDKAISTTEQLINNSKQQKKALMQQLLTGKKRLFDDSGKPFDSGWEEISISNLGAIYSGGTPSTSNKEYWNGGIDWITPTDITKQKSVYINSSARKISQKGLKNSSAKLVPKGSLLVCTRATIGEMAITSHEMCTNQGFKNIVPNEKANIEFIYYLLTFEKHKLVSKSSGSTFLELSKSAFESMVFKIPTVNEQQKISAVLINIDKEIELLKQQLADFKQEKKALMQQLLTGKRRVKIKEKEVA